MQQQPTFETSTSGKWILAGEHAVLRGSSAIIFPVYSKQLHMTYYENSADEEVSAEFTGHYTEEMQFLFWSSIKQALSLLQLHYSDFKGKFVFDNQIPIGTGMGGSAAMCVAIGRFCVFKGFINEGFLLEFARQIENLFHNESSGADIAVSIAQRGILFSRTAGIEYLQVNWQPNWYLSFSGCISSTSQCVQQVKKMFEENEIKAERLDNDMALSVALATKALQLPKQEGFPLLLQAIEKARLCFEQWGLIDGAIKQHIHLLSSQGAMAVKPTGSGNGGFVLSLWQEYPPQLNGVEFIKLF